MNVRTSRPLRTTWRWTWLSGGTSIEDVAADLGGARQPPVGGQPLLGAIGRLQLGERRQVARLGRDPVLRELAETLRHLAAAADAAPAADRVDVDAERRARHRGRSSRSANRPRRPDGVKMTSASSATVGRLPLADRDGAAVDPAAADLALRAGTRWALIQRAQSGSWPIRTSAAMTQALTSGISGLVIAEVIPAAMAIGRKAALMPSRFGSPKLTFEAPQVVLTLSSSRSRRTSCEDLLAGLGERPDRHDQRVDDDVRARDAVVGRPLDDPLGDREPDVGVHADPGVVVADRDDRRAVLADERQDALEALLLAGHRVEQRLALVDGEARPRAPRRSTSRSTAAGRSGSGRAGSCRARIAGSSASGMPALTSSMWAPASTWASTSRSTRLKSPAFISSASSLRPVGLIRSPMMTNGRSKPMTTSRVAELMMVSVMPAEISDVVAGGRAGPPATPPDWISSARWCFVVVGLEPLRLRP